jgi:hypothetical protein
VSRARLSEMRVGKFVPPMVLATLMSALVLLPGLGCAPSSGSPVSPAELPDAQPAYHPSMGDLMTMAIQPRHIKLELAGRQKNWTYAEYELSELRNAFGRVGRTIPVYRAGDMTALIGALTTESLDAVQQSIRAHDAARFAAAYERLTSSCNACHLSQGHAMVVIRVPNGNDFTDQEFRVAPN